MKVRKIPWGNVAPGSHLLIRLTSLIALKGKGTNHRINMEAGGGGVRRGTFSVLFTVGFQCLETLIGVP